MHEVDPELLGLARDFVNSDDVIWDVGANVGLFSVAAAQRAGSSGSVFAFEPDDYLIGLLRRTASVQSMAAATITPISAAVARKVDVRTFCIAKRSRSTNFLEGYGTTQAGGVSEFRSIITVTLDWLRERLPPPNLLKIDVEGAELEVLEGGIGLLSETRPTILCEVAGASASSVYDLLSGNDYVLFDASTAAAERTPQDAAPWSTIALPREKLANICVIEAAEETTVSSEDVAPL